VLKRNSMRSACSLSLATLASFVRRSRTAGHAGATPASGSGTRLLRLKVGDLGSDGAIRWDGRYSICNWLIGPTATMDGVLEQLHEDPHLSARLLIVASFVNTGKHSIIVDVGTGAGWGGQHSGACG